LIIISLHRVRKPFAIIISNEICGKVYSILYQDRYLRCQDLKRLDIRWFNDNRYLFKRVVNNEFGEIYEYKQFKKRMNQALKHNLLIRNQIIKGQYI
jgi:hypothetical protein